MSDITDLIAQERECAHDLSQYEGEHGTASAYEDAKEATDKALEAATVPSEGEREVLREFLQSALAESDADERDPNGGSGWDVEVDAHTVLRLLDGDADARFRLPVPVRITDEMVERAAKSTFEPSDLPARYTWAEMVAEDPKRADIWRDDARRVLLDALGAVTVEPETHEPFPESTHVEAKYWAELVKARRRITELEAVAAVEPESAEQLDALPNKTVILDRFGDVLQYRDGLWCSYETKAFGSEWVWRKFAPLTVIHLPATPGEPVQVDPQPHDSGSCPNGGGYSCTNHEPHDSGQVTEVDE